MPASTRTRAYTDALELALGRVIADARRDMALVAARGDAAVAGLMARNAELEARHAALENEFRAMAAERAEALTATLQARVDGLGGELRSAVADGVASIAEARSATEARLDALGAAQVEQAAESAEAAQRAASAAAAGILVLTERIDATPPPPDLEPILERLAAVEQRKPPPVDLAPLQARLDDLEARQPPDLEPLAARIDEVANACATVLLTADKAFAQHEAATAASIAAADRGADIASISDRVLDLETTVAAAAQTTVERFSEIDSAIADARDRPGREGPPGKLGAVRAWTDGVHYEADVVTHAGATWQAQRDTGRAPSADSADWLMLAAPGVDGAPGAGFRVRGTWSADADDYLAHDIAMLGGSSFVALRDAPGECPGPGWQLWASRGGKGEPSKERGLKGDTVIGPPGPPIVAATVSDNGVLTLVNGDGSTVEADFYPLFDKVARA